MICHYCNCNIPEGSRICPTCGKNLSVWYCSRCGAEVSEGSRFCRKCGIKIVTNACTACGTEIPANTGLCPNCGKDTMNVPFYQRTAIMPTPERAIKQEPNSHGKKSLTGSKKYIIILIIISAVIVAFSLYIIFYQRTISSEENNALWGKANTALAAFVGDNQALFAVDGANTITPEEISKVTQQIGDFDKALKALESVKPPADELIVQEMLLPMYRGIYDQMGTIKNALVAGDPLKIDLEVQRLRILLDELGGISDMLATKTLSAGATTPSPT
jgi:hypothetical protein